MTKKELWLQLKAYRFEHLVTPNLLEFLGEKFGTGNASTRAFAHKLARKHGWTNSFALQALAEYKKFVYLGVVSDFIVTPPEVLDLVWHQHILFSKAYRRFCTDVIAYEFDHTPELIPLSTQTDLYAAQYLATLALYKTEFGIDAPENIWGQPKFDAALLTGKAFNKKRRAVLADGGGADYDSTPLIASFDSPETSSMAEFGGFDGGDGGGAGAGDSWSSDSSDASGDASCSSCSSGCGGD